MITKFHNYFTNLIFLVQFLKEIQINLIMLIHLCFLVQFLLIVDKYEPNKVYHKKFFIRYLIYIYNNSIIPLMALSIHLKLHTLIRL